jgi:hypothetical protein
MDSYCNFLWLVFDEDPTSDFIEQCIIIALKERDIEGGH